MFLNLSSDKVEIYYWNSFILLEKNDLERTFPTKLKEIFQSSQISSIFILNWPGSFTTLRIWSLTLNIINWLLNFKLNFYNISKLQFYKFFVDKNILPSLGIIYIWQRKKARLYDFKKNNFEYIFYKNLENLHKDYFVDKIYSIKSHNKINFYLENGNLILKFKDNFFKVNLNKLPFHQEKYIKPNYILKPNICLKNS